MADPAAERAARTGCCLGGFRAAKPPAPSTEDVVHRPVLDGGLSLELVRFRPAHSLLRGDDRSGHLRRPPLHALLPLLQVPQELRPQSATGTSTNCPASPSSCPSSTSSSSSTASSKPSAPWSTRAKSSKSRCSTTRPTRRTQVASAIVDRYAALGHPIVYIHRTNRHGYKAGALDAGLKVAKGEFVAIFDADFVPPPDWLMKVIHHFAEPEIGMVQTRWTHLNRDYSMLTQIEAILLDGHFVLEHGARVRTGDFFNFNGTAGMWRSQGHLRRRRLAARHAHRRHRPQLPLADGRMEVQIPARGRVPLRAAHRDDRLQDAAGALGQGPHPDQHQGAAHDLPVECAAAHQGRGRLPPHRQPELSADGRHVGVAHSGHDLPLLSGLVSDAAHRRAAVHRVDVLHRRVLPGQPARSSSPKPG